MAEMEELLERVKKATEPHRELDDALARAFGWTFDVRSEGGRVWTEWKRPEGFRLPLGTLADPPFFTASLDAALALVERVLPGFVWMVQTDFELPGRAYIYGEVWGKRDHGTSADGATPALALLASLLRAIIKDQDHG